VTKQPDQTFASRIRGGRQRAGISQAELSRRLAAVMGYTIDSSAISRSEKGVRAVPLDEAVAIADLLEIPLDGMTPESIKAEARVLRLRQDLRRARIHLDETHGKVQQAEARVASVKRELAEAESARRQRSQ